MKRILACLFLVTTAAPLMATDDGGDGAIIPSYAELVREGYGVRPSEYYQNYQMYSYSPVHGVPKPTQAYYAKGYTIYYGYGAVPVRTADTNLLYAFGYPVEYFKKMMPASVDSANLSKYAVAIGTPQKSIYAPGEFVARNSRKSAVTSVVASRSTTTTKKATTAVAAAPVAGTLPPIGEKLP